MVDYRFNDISKSWVIISPKRSKRPENHSGKKVVKEKICPFCFGNEEMTPPEISRIGEGLPGKPGWKVRVVPNKFKITDIHEVIIHGPEHNKDFEDMTLSHLELIFKTYVDRYNAHRKEGQVIIFNNSGKEAGESLEHDHSQLTVVPDNIKIKKQPLPNIKKPAFQSEHIKVFSPQNAEWPFETWFVPQRKGFFWGDVKEEEISDLVSLLKQSISIFKQEVGKYAYNYYIYPHKNWYLRFIPRISKRAGFELASGIMVNTKDPNEVTSLLKNNLKLI